MGFLGGVLGFLGLDGIAADLVSLIQFVYSVLVEVANFIWNALVTVANFLLAGLQLIGKFLQTIWDKFFKGIFTKVFDALVKAHDWLEEHLRPIIDFLKKVRAFVDRIYRLYVKPFLDMLQHIRRVLLVLRALHVKFAQELDAKIAGIENQIQSVFLDVRRQLNTLIDTLNLIADPTLLVRKPAYIISARRTFNAMIRVYTGKPPSYFFPSPRPGLPPYLGILPANANLNDPLINPPASFYLAADDGFAGSSFLAGDTPLPDSSVDDLEMLDYFDDDLYPAPACGDPISCFRAIRNTQIQNMSTVVS